MSMLASTERKVSALETELVVLSQNVSRDSALGHVRSIQRTLFVLEPDVQKLIMKANEVDVSKRVLNELSVEKVHALARKFALVKAFAETAEQALSEGRACPKFSKEVPITIHTAALSLQDRRPSVTSPPLVLDKELDEREKRRLQQLEAIAKRTASMSSLFPPADPPPPVSSKATRRFSTGSILPNLSRIFGSLSPPSSFPATTTSTAPTTASSTATTSSKTHATTATAPTTASASTATATSTATTTSTTTATSTNITAPATTATVTATTTATSAAPTTATHNTTTSTAKTSANTASSPSPDLGMWECTVCTLLNEPTVTVCGACNIPSMTRVAAQVNKEASSSAPKAAKVLGITESKEEEWSCPACTYLNLPNHTSCAICQLSRSGVGRSSKRSRDEQIEMDEIPFSASSRARSKSDSDVFPSEGKTEGKTERKASETEMKHAAFPFLDRGASGSRSYDGAKAAKVAGPTRACHPCNCGVKCMAFGFPPFRHHLEAFAWLVHVSMSTAPAFASASSTLTLLSTQFLASSSLSSLGSSSSSSSSNSSSSSDNNSGPSSSSTPSSESWTLRYSYGQKNNNNNNDNIFCIKLITLKQHLLVQAKIEGDPRAVFICQFLPAELPPIESSNLTINFTESSTLNFIHTIHDKIASLLIGRVSCLQEHNVSVMTLKETLSHALATRENVQSNTEALSLAVHCIMLLEGFTPLPLNATSISTTNTSTTTAPTTTTIHYVSSTTHPSCIEPVTSDAASSSTRTTTSATVATASASTAVMVPPGWNKGAPRLCSFLYRHESGLEVVVKCMLVGDRLMVSGKLTDSSAHPFLQPQALTPIFTLQLPLNRFILPKVAPSAGPLASYTDFLGLLTLVRNGLAKRVLNPLWFASPTSHSLLLLPPEILVGCLGYLKGDELARLAVVSRACLSAASAPMLWQILCEREKILVGEASRTHWKNAYASHACEAQETEKQQAAWRRRRHLLRPQYFPLPRFPFSFPEPFDI